MSETKPTNPPLFDTMEMQETVYETGVTLRDFFAGLALAGMLAHPVDGAIPVEYAGDAYDFADAMLAERGRK
jgi:hypothetical protein